MLWSLTDILLPAVYLYVYCILTNYLVVQVEQPNGCMCVQTHDLAIWHLDPTKVKETGQKLSLEQQGSHRPHTPRVDTSGVSFSIRHFLVAIYTGTLCASMMS